MMIRGLPLRHAWWWTWVHLMMLLVLTPLGSYNSPLSMVQAEEEKKGAGGSETFTAYPLPFVLWRYNYNSGFNDKRTTWFYKVARTVKLLNGTLVLPYFNSYKKSVAGSVRYNPFDFYFNKEHFEGYIPCITTEDFHAMSNGLVDRLIAPPKVAQRSFQACNANATKKISPTKFNFFEQPHLEFVAKRLDCMNGRDLAKELEKIKADRTVSVAIDGFDNHGGRDNHFSGPRNVPQPAPYIQFNPSIFQEAIHILNSKNLRPVQWPLDSPVPQVLGITGTIPFYALHWRWPKNARANVHHPAEMVNKAFGKMLGSGSLPLPPRTTSLWLWLAAAMASRRELEELVSLLNSTAAEAGYDLRLLTHDDKGLVSADFAKHEGLLAILEQVMGALAEGFLGSDRSTMTEVILEMRRQMLLAEKTFTIANSKGFPRAAKPREDLAGWKPH